MKATLTPEDIKSLRYECRPGILFGVGIFFLGGLVIYMCFVLMSEKAADNIYLYTFGSLSIIMLVSFILGRIFISKYLQDIKNNEKDLIRYPIQKKEGKVDNEVGSGSLRIGQEMKACDHFLLTIDDSIHDVDKEMFERANVGDEVTMHIAPVSGHVLKIELSR
ncbi:MAG: hypothetical protein WCL06_09530 [Bacteroidota bacterium]